MTQASKARASHRPGLRLLVERGHLLRVRPLVGLLGLLARGGLFRAYALWPRADEPLIAVDLRHPPAAAWLRATFEPDAGAPGLFSAATWNALRAGALLVGQPSRLTLEAAEDGLGRALLRPRLCTYSPTGKSLSKTTCFVFERDGAAPSVVVKAMPERRHAERLRHEVELVEIVRTRLSSVPALALPLPPLWTWELDGDYVVVQPVDPLAADTGRATRPAALRWLSAFQADTTGRIQEWGADDSRRACEEVRYAWRRARPESEPAVSARVGELLECLQGQPVRRCAVHGDFWRGNLAEGGGGLRVYDWEWAKLEGDPFVDLWTYELAELRQRAERESFELVPALEDALGRVEAELGAQDLDPRFALATAAPMIGQLAFRVRRATGLAGGGEGASVKLMEALETLILGSGARAG
jgi:hypothetical protein